MDISSSGSLKTLMIAISVALIFRNHVIDLKNFNHRIKSKLLQFFVRTSFFRKFKFQQ